VGRIKTALLFAIGNKLNYLDYYPVKMKRFPVFVSLVL